MAYLVRRIHDAHFKTKVVLEALKGHKTLAQLSSEIGIHAQMITTGLASQWKRQALNAMPAAFEAGTSKPPLCAGAKNMTKIMRQPLLNP